MKRFAGRIAVVVLAVATLGSALTACSSGDDTLKVGVSPVPHGEILKYVKDKLAKKEGLDIEIVEFTDYVQPNAALQSGDLDANYFQHVPYLKEEAKAKGYKFTPLKPVHVEPLGIYSKKFDKLSEVPTGAEVAIPNDPSNSGRALKLLADNGIIELKAGIGVNATKRDVAGNPKKLRFSELEAAQLPRSLDDTALSVINGNYAIETKLNPAKDALALESAKDNPYANLLVVRTEDKGDERLAKLDKLLHSPEVEKFIEQKYNKSVLPATS